MPLPVRSRSLRAETREASTSSQRSQIPHSRTTSRNVSPTKALPKTTDERIEAAKQRRLSLASKDGDRRSSSLQQASADRKTSGPPPSSFKVPPRPLRSNSTSRPSVPGRRESDVSRQDTAAPKRTPSLSRGRDSTGGQDQGQRRTSTHRQQIETTANTSVRRSSGAAAAPRPSGLRQPSPTKTLPTRSVSTRTPSTRTTSHTSTPPPAPASDRPAFSTNQQHFTPAKRLPRHGSASPQKPAQAPTIRTFQTLKSQAHLLQLHLLSQDFERSYAAWTQSAHDKLHAKFVALQETYASSLRTARSARQARNLLALHQWSGGNEASLARKLSVLGTVLGELCELTRGDDAWVGCDEAAARGWWVDGDDGTGEYTRVVRQFEGWVQWVEFVWSARDRVRGVDGDGDVSPPVTPAPRRASRSLPVEIPAEVQQIADTQLEGLGDGVKSSIKSMGTTLDRLAIRLEDLRNPEIPVPIPGEEGEEVGVGPVPDPKVLVAVAGRLVEGMREELQVMREVEFEVTIGEKTWAEQRVKDIGESVASGFATPGFR